MTSLCLYPGLTHYASSGAPLLFYAHAGRHP